MKRKPPKKVMAELAARLVEISIKTAQLIPDETLGRVALGQCMLVIWRTEEICPCCQKHVTRVCTAEKTQRPLEEIFQS